MPNLQKWTTAIVVASAVTLGGCHVFKAPQVVKSADVTVMQKTSQPVDTLSGLSRRVGVLENRLDTARAARLARLKAAVKAQ